jgi:hypothetical protein
MFFSPFSCIGQRVGHVVFGVVHIMVTTRCTTEGHGSSLGERVGSGMDHGWGYYNYITFVLSVAWIWDRVYDGMAREYILYTWYSFSTPYGAMSMKVTTATMGYLAGLLHRKSCSRSGWDAVDHAQLDSFQHRRGPWPYYRQTISALW